jgi:hydroxymethylbilane synthase
MPQPSTTKRPLVRIGTRGSKLAMWQANWVAEQLAARGVLSELVTISTRGDQQPDGSVASLGTDGVFTKELQKALLVGRIDVAVHSLKDLPTDPVEGIIFAAVPKRESPFDVLVSRTRQQFNQLPIGALLGTGSLRRRAQLLHARPDLKFSEVRGNIDTRLRKLREGQVDALVLAEAGLKRLGWEADITEVFTPELILPAVGQGALGIEVRSDDQTCRELLSQVDDPATHQSVVAERTLLASLRGGCLAPIGAWGRVEVDGRLHLSACVVSGDGSSRLFADRFGNAADAVAIGRQVAESLLADGATKLIEQSRGQ